MDRMWGVGVEGLSGGAMVLGYFMNEEDAEGGGSDGKEKIEASMLRGEHV